MTLTIGKLVHLGVSDSQSHSERRRIRTINAVAMVAFSATAFFMFLFIPARPSARISVWAYFMLGAVYLAGYALTLVLNRLGHHEWAAVLLLMTGLVNLLGVGATVGFATGSAVFLVAIGMTSVLVTSHEAGVVRWLFVALAAVAYAAFVFVDPPVAQSIAGTWTEDLLVAASFTGMVGFVVSVVWYQRLLADRAEDALTEANERAERLILNILPADIADRLKTGEYPIADRKPRVTVLFADVVGSTAIAERLSAAELVETLDRLFSSFDDIADEHGLEKIKTAGDSYFAIAGLSHDGGDDASSAADAALMMRRELVNHRFPNEGQVHMRFGLHTGSVIAGVIGKRKFSYDVWGDTVNTASRMESTSETDTIQVSQEVYDRLKDRYELAARGSIAIKGKGDLVTYELIRRRIAPNPGP